MKPLKKKPQIWRLKKAGEINMKHITRLVIIAAAAAAMGGCSSDGENVSSNKASSASSVLSDMDTAESSKEVSIKQASVQSSEEPDYSLPAGIRYSGNGKLGYSTSVLSMSVTFPVEFNYKAEGYQPSYGVYLQNDTGTATLLLEAVNDNTLSYRNMKDYLQEKYPDADVRITDKKDVTCKMSMKDPSGNSYLTMQKIRLVRGGYQLASLCCRPEDEKKYSSVFNEISFI